MDELKFCKRCRHAETDGYGKLVNYPVCLRAKHTVDPVTGKPQGRFCQVERDSHLEECCGKGAKFFEPIQ